jgi:hypothetical protein
MDEGIFFIEETEPVKTTFEWQKGANQSNGKKAVMSNRIWVRRHGQEVAGRVAGRDSGRMLGSSLRSLLALDCFKCCGFVAAQNL